MWITHHNEVTWYFLVATYLINKLQYEIYSILNRWEFPSLLPLPYDLNTLKPLYKMAHYNMVSDIKVDPKSVVSKQKCIDHIDKSTASIIPHQFGQNPSTFTQVTVWKQKYGQAENWVKNWRNLPISNPKLDLYNINAHTKFGKNPLIFTQVIGQKRKYRWKDVHMTEGRTDRWTHGWPMWNHNTPPLSCGRV